MYLRTLGTLALEGSNFHRPKPLLLLTYLALEGSKSRRELAELLWRDSRDPRDSLSTAVNLLNSNTRAVTVERDRLQANVRCDASEFQQAVQDQQLETALDLYRGAFLDGLSLALAEEIEEWLYTTRERLANQARQIHLQLAQQALRSEDSGRAGMHAGLALDVQHAPPWEVNGLREVSRVLLQCGSPRVVEVERDAEELGVSLEPSGGPAWRRTVPPSNLPNVTTSLVGREQELQQLLDLLASEVRLLTISGLGGMGKTRLSLALASRLLEREAFERVFFVALDTLGNPEQILPRIAATLDIPIPAETEALEAVGNHIAGERLLLVLDNFEHLTSGAHVLSDLLAGCPGLKVVVTSRELLGVEEEWNYPLEGLPLPEDAAAALGSAESLSAVQLFVQRAKRSDARFTIDASNTGAVLEVCRLAGGMPLAIELAAAWVRVMPPQEIAREIQSSIDFLTNSSPTAKVRQRSVGAVIEYSWQLLTNEEREVLMGLTVFQGGFTRDAAARVAGASNEVLASLVKKSLVHGEQPGRYGLHSLVRQHAQEKLVLQPQLQAEVAARHGSYFLSYVQNSVGRSDELTRLDAEYPNVLAAMRHDSTMRDQALLVNLMRLLVVDGAYHACRGHTPQSLELLRAAGAAARRLGDARTAHHLLGKLGDAYKFYLGEPELALHAYGEALELAEQLRDHHRQVIMLSCIGETRSRQGAEDAESYYERGFEIAIRHGDSLGMDHILQNQVLQAVGLRDLTGARRLLQGSLVTLEELRTADPYPSPKVEEHLFNALLNLGEVERLAGDFPRALEHRQRALRMAEESNNDIWKAYALQEIGETYHGMNVREEALRHFTHALELWRQNHAPAKVKGLLALMKAEGYPTSETEIQPP